MKSQYVINENSLSLEIHGGYKEIGGNCIVVKDKDKKIVFDNGIRFSILKRFYRGRIQPLGPNELRSIGAIPPLEIFEDVDAVYISHFHLDHLGLLGALPPGTKVYVPSVNILEIVEEWYRTSPTWLAEIPHKLHIEVCELTPYKEDEQGVMAIPVSHSAYPSYSLVYRGFNKTVFYSGDFRVDGPLGSQINTITNLAKATEESSMDLALIEGTNIGSIETPISSQDFRSMFNRILMESGLVVVSIDPLDFEMLSTMWGIALLNNRTLVIASDRIIDVIPQWLETFEISEGLENLAISIELERPSLVPTQYVSIREDVLKDPERYLLVQEPIGFLEMLRQMRLWGEKLPRKATAILTTPEPLEAESELEEQTLASWLYSLGMQVYRLRLSGHYYPYELKKILMTLRPQKIIPIHTKHPNLMLKLMV
ncbi:MAG: MBL fold metallo-hydrolase [Candidatus Njordarchaeales archaeon]